jgi:hypothetical protein
MSADITANGVNALGVSIEYLQAGLINNANLYAAGGVSTIMATQWLNGQISMLWLGSMNIIGGGVAGDLGATVIMRSANDWGSSLGYAWVAGDMVNNMTWDYLLGSLVGPVYVNGQLVVI